MAAPTREALPTIEMEGDFDWPCPTEAERKLIQARRERNDRISKIMGDYLLKGYTMLGTTCEECQTILLRNKMGKNYCISCSELDSDTDKDDPVVSQEAALSQVRESELSSKLSFESNPHGTMDAFSSNQNVDKAFSSNQNVDMDKMKTARVASINTCAAKSGFSSHSDIKRIKTVSSSEEDTPFLSASVPTFVSRQVGEVQADSQMDMTETLSVLCSKIHWATEELRTTASPDYNIVLCRLIKHAADAIESVNKNVK
ncbi:hypothetical protein ScPMuIL_014876 [Solemya velum]